MPSIARNAWVQAQPLAGERTGRESKPVAISTNTDHAQVLQHVPRIAIVADPAQAIGSPVEQGKIVDCSIFNRKNKNEAALGDRHFANVSGFVD